MTVHLSEAQEKPWLLVASPLIWAAHFLLSYCTAAIWCAKVPSGASSMRFVLAAYTLAALAALARIAHQSLRRRRIEPDVRARAERQDVARHRFLGLVSLLLAGMSGLAILYASFAVALIRTCR